MARPDTEKSSRPKKNSKAGHSRLGDGRARYREIVRTKKKKKNYKDRALKTRGWAAQIQGKCED